MSYYFCVVGTKDNLLYEADLSSTSISSSSVTGTSSGTSTGATPDTDRQRQSAVFGFTNALGQWTSGFPLRPASISTQEAVKEENKLSNASSFTNERHILQMIAHGSLDTLEDRQFLDSNMYVIYICLYLTQLHEKFGQGL